MMRKGLNFSVMWCHIISENQVAISILIMIRIFIDFNSLFNVYKFYEMKHGFICEEKLTLNNSNVQRTFIFANTGLNKSSLGITSREQRKKFGGRLRLDSRTVLDKNQ